MTGNGFPESRAVGLLLRPEMVYTFSVELGNRIVPIIIEFNPAAFKHGLTETDIRYAFSTAIYDDIWDTDTDKHLIIGFDSSSNLLEIMYNVIDEQTINVFHAMKCRNIYYQLLLNTGEDHAKNDR